MEKLTGSELVKRVLKDPNGSVEQLLALAQNKETEWLELKASLLPEFVLENGGKRYLRKPNENDEDYLWNVAKALVAMANTNGGVVLLGINDNLEVVGLEFSDKKNKWHQGEDAFARDVLDPALRPVKRSWNCHKESYILTGATYFQLLEYQYADYQGKRVAAIIVNPVPQGGTLLFVEESQKQREKLLIRDIGATGRVRELYRNSEIQTYIQQREPSQESYALLYDQFKATMLQQEGRDSTEPTEPEGLLEAVQTYHDLLRRACAQDDRLFIPLDAEENTRLSTEAELFEPMAEEYLTAELDWLDDAEDGIQDDQPGEDQPDDDQEGDDEAQDDRFLEALRNARRGGVFTLLQEEPRAMLLGEPGGGKTTCLRHLALRSVEEFADTGKVALFVPLSRYRGPGDLMPLLVRATRADKHKSGLSLAHIEWLLKHSRLTLLLDALNECPSEYTLHCVEDILSCLNRFPSLPVVITARTYAYREQIGLTAFTVQPMDAAQQQAFLAVHLQSETRAREITDQLQQHPGGETLASNPLLLLLVVKAVRDGQPLPPGRAKLYRQFLERWHTREANKAKLSQRPLPWTREQTLTALAQLAFATRSAGLRSIHREQAIVFLKDAVTEPEAFLDRMAQGLILTCDFEGMMDFLHETFQEYLAAEHILNNHQAVYEIKPEEQDRWSMVLAYVIELNPSPPLDLLEGIARVDEWIAGCADNSMNLIFFGYENIFFKIFTSNSNNNKYILLKKREVSYLLKIPRKPFIYLLKCLNSAQERYINLGNFVVKSLFNISKNKNIEKIIDLYVLLKKCGWYITESQFINYNKVSDFKIACKLIECGLAKPDDFVHNVEEWTKTINRSDAVKMVQAGLAKPHSFSKNIKKWANTNNINIASKLLLTGLAKPSDFKKDTIAIELVRKGLAKQDDFAERIEGWIETSNPNIAILLVRAGIAKPNIFADRINEWTKTSNTITSIQLVQTKIANPNLFNHRIENWARISKPNIAVELVKAGIAKPSDFQKHNIAIELVRKGLAKQDDFAERIKGWIETSNPKIATLLVRAGLANSDNFVNKIKQWVNTSGPNVAIELVRTGIAKPDDFVDKIKEWKNTLDLHIAIELVRTGIAKPDDFTKQNIAIGLVQSGILNRYKYQEMIQNTSNIANINDTVEIAGSSIMQKNDFLQKINDNKRDVIYKNNDIQTKETREIYSSILKSQHHDLYICHIFFPKHISCIAKSEIFPDGVFFHTNKFKMDNIHDLSVGDKIYAKVCITLNLKKSEWGYSVQECNAVVPSQITIPLWWRSWDILLTQFAHGANCVTPHKMRRNPRVTSLRLCAHSWIARYC